MPTGRSFKSVIYKLIEGPAAVPAGVLSLVTGRRMTCGFEEDNLTQTMWNQQNESAGGTFRISSDTQHGGAKSAKLAMPSLGSASLVRIYDGTASPFDDLIEAPYTGQVSYYFRHTGDLPVAPSAYVIITKAIGVIGIDPNARLKLANRNESTIITGTTVLVANTWYRLEYTMTADASFNMVYTLQLFLGDAATALETLTTSEALSSVTSDWDRTQLGDTVQGTGRKLTAYFDDFIIQRNPYLTMGPRKIILLVPDGDIAVAWGRLIGTKNYQNIDDLPGLPDDDTSYTTTTSTTAEDRFRHPGVPIPVTSQLRILDLYARVRSGSGAPTMVLKMWDNTGVAIVGPTITLDTTWRRLDTLRHLVGDISTFRKAQVDGFNLGYLANGASGAERRVTALWANLEYIP